MSIVSLLSWVFHSSLEPVFSFGILGPEDNVIEHGSANFTCKGNGSINTIVWMKEEEILASSSSITFVDDNRTMVISPVSRSDSGYYQCAMSNPVSSSNSSYSITVNCKYQTTLALKQKVSHFY